MTENQLKIVADFEARVRRLMSLCDYLKQENAELKAQLIAQKASYDLLADENTKLNLKYDNLKMARIITVKQDDFKKAKTRLSGLVREVDKCIALLNE